MKNIRINIDKNLWFTLECDGCSGRHYILGNPHTFPGRIMGYCPEKNKSFFFSVSEIIDMSIETGYWIKGYLTGNEPSPPQSEDGPVDFNSQEYKHWKKRIKDFHKTGYWNVHE